MNEFDTNDTKNAVLHWRYYYDPPEFQVCTSNKVLLKPKI